VKENMAGVIETMAEVTWIRIAEKDHLRTVIR